MEVNLTFWFKGVLKLRQVKIPSASHAVADILSVFFFFCQRLHIPTITF